MKSTTPFGILVFGSACLVAWTPPAVAGHEGGNGGGALFCPSGGNVSYDLALAFALNPSLKMPHTATAAELREMEWAEIENLVEGNIEDLLSHLKPMMPEAYKIIRSNARDFMSGGDFIPNYRIPELHDSYPHLLGVCDFRYIARWHQHWEIDQDSWNLLDLSSRTALVLHESIYRAGKTAPDSLEAVRLTALILSHTLDRLNPIETFNRMQSRYLPGSFAPGKDCGVLAWPETCPSVKIEPSQVPLYPFHLPTSDPTAETPYTFSAWYQCTSLQAGPVPAFSIRLFGDLIQVYQPEKKDSVFSGISTQYAIARTNKSILFEFENSFLNPHQQIFLPKIEAQNENPFEASITSAKSSFPYICKKSVDPSDFPLAR